LLKVPPTWRELHARGQRLLNSGLEMADMLEKLGVSQLKWQNIAEACSTTVLGSHFIT
jgi:TolA-binding protein